MRRSRQLEFSFPCGHGGARKGSGRKRQGTRASVRHRTRKSFSKPSVLHVTCRIAEGLPSLRDPRTVALLFNYLARICAREGFRIVEFSIQGNHMHMLCEADNDEALSRAMNAILSILARGLNEHWKRTGKVFAGRYHTETIETPAQCHKALIYVLANAKKHGARSLDSGIDPCSTAPWFPFETSALNHPLNHHTKPAASPQTWLLRTGWRKRGPITPKAHPCLPKRKRTKEPRADSDQASLSEATG